MFSSLTGMFKARPKGLPAAVSLRPKNGLEIHHKGPRQEGLKGVEFRDEEEFARVLEENGLSPYDWQKIESSNVHLGTMFVWANDDVMVVVNTNPLEETHSRKPHITTWGYAELMGIEGKPEHVRELYDDIVDSARSIDETGTHRRDYI